MTSNITCIDDFDCPGTERCVTREMHWTSETNFCTCFYYYGYTGEDCLERGPQTYFVITANSIAIMIIGYFILICFRDIFRFFLQRKTLRLNAALITWIYTVVGFSCFLAWRSLILVQALDPELHKSKIANEAVGTTGVKLPEYNLQTRLVQLPVHASVVCSSLSISLMWLEVAYRTKHLSTVRSPLVKKYYRVNYAMQAIYISLLIVLIVLDQIGYAALLSVPFLFVIIITFAMGQMKVSKLIEEFIQMTGAGILQIKDSESKQRKYKTSLKNVTQTSRNILVLYAVLIAFLIAVFVLNEKSYGELTSPGEISIYYLSQEGSMFSLLAILITTNTYVRRSSLNRSHTKTDDSSSKITDKDSKSTRITGTPQLTGSKKPAHISKENSVSTNKKPAHISTENPVSTNNANINVSI